MTGASVPEGREGAAPGTRSSCPLGDAMVALSKTNRAAAMLFRLTNGLLLILALILLTLNVVLRYFFGYSIIWAEEAVRYAFVWIVMLSAAMLTRDAAHISMEALYNLMPAAWQKAMRMFAGVLTMGVALLLIKASWTLLGLMHASRVLSPAAHVPMAWVYAIFPVALVFMILGALEDAVSVGKGTVRGDSREKELQL